MTERDNPLEAADAALHVMDACIEAHQTNALGHLRAAEYVALFDDAIMRFFAIAGLTGPDLKHRGHTTPFLMDLHATYLRELGAGDQVAITVQVLDVDARRARIFLQMHKQDAVDAARDIHSTDRCG